MQTLSLELDEETMETLEVERSLIGFESRAAYVRWIIQHRAAIEQEADAGEVLTAYSERIAKLESRLASIEADDDGPELPATGDAIGSSDDIRPEDGSEPTEATSGKRTTADGGWTSTTTGESSIGENSNGSQLSASPSSVSEEICATNLRPERVERIRDDALSDDAGVLGSVEGDRLDELSRRAVAKTRETLNRDVETGLEYRSSTDLADTAGDIRPGDDVADLDSIDVPGRSGDLVDQRRELVGRALAHLRDEGAARKSDFVDALYEEYPAGYGSPGGWWRCLKRGLKQVESVGGGDGSRIWRIDE
ncbi:hypothetical protein [Halovivax gelatinilyticus]|uniref:hypothetical protein n=1 Tax=Halovivax gelatinilyticus TaxID=2961597 RepID=UPI0020CA37F9|nr:hypothetical protein [Halovivax gelatinilyticus]